LRPLGRVKGHEECAERAAQDDRERGPEQIAAERDAQHADRERRQVRIAREPYRPEVPDLAVALGQRHVVDRALLDESAGNQDSPFGGSFTALVCYIITTTL